MKPRAAALAADVAAREPNRVGLVEAAGGVTRRKEAVDDSHDVANDGPPILVGDVEMPQCAGPPRRHLGHHSEQPWNATSGGNDRTTAGALRAERPRNRTRKGASANGDHRDSSFEERVSSEHSWFPLVAESRAY